MSKQKIILALSSIFISKYIEIELTADINFINEINIILYKFFCYVIYLAFFMKITKSFTNITSNNDSEYNNFKIIISNIHLTDFLIQIETKIISFTIYITPEFLTKLGINRHMIDFELISLINKAIENDITFFRKIINNSFNNANTILLKKLGLIERNKLSNNLSQYKLEIHIPNISILNIQANILTYFRGKFRVDEYIIRPNTSICYSDIVSEILDEFNDEIEGRVSTSKNGDCIESKTIGQLKFTKICSHLKYRYPKYSYIYIIPLIYRNLHKQKEMWTMKIFKL